MSTDIVTIKASGPVSLDDLRVLAASIADLTAALTREAAGAVPIDWRVTGLQYGSAKITARGVPAKLAAIALVASITSRFDDVARAANRGAITGFSPAVQEPIRRAARLINGPVEAVLLGAGDDTAPWPIDHSLADATDESDDTADDAADLHAYVRTAVKGQVVTLDDKRQLYFTLRRAHTGELVRCYPDRSNVELRKRLSEYWSTGAWVFVEGTYNQQAPTPTLYFITDVIPLPTARRGAWREAAGVAPRPADRGDLSVADAVEGARDADD